MCQSVLVDGPNGAGLQLPVVGEKDEDLPSVRDEDLDPSQQIGEQYNLSRARSPVRWVNSSLSTWRC